MSRFTQLAVSRRHVGGRQRRHTLLLLRGVVVVGAALCIFAMAAVQQLQYTTNNIAANKGRDDSFSQRHQQHSAGRVVGPASLLRTPRMLVQSAQGQQSQPSSLGRVLKPNKKKKKKKNVEESPPDVGKNVNPAGEMEEEMPPELDVKQEINKLKAEVAEVKKENEKKNKNKQADAKAKNTSTAGDAIGEDVDDEDGGEDEDLDLDETDSNQQYEQHVGTPAEILEDVDEAEEEEFWEDGNSGPVEPEDVAVQNIPQKKYVIQFNNLIPNQRGKRVGALTIVTHPEWAPIGTQHFHDLVESGFYKKSKFFRVLPGFIAQFGINGDPEIQKQAKEVVLEDDPVLHTNARGTLSYATSGPNTRTTQLFFNLNENGNDDLDRQGFAPFAEVVEGMDILDRINGQYGEKPRQNLINKMGDTYLDANYPGLTYIRHIWEEKIENVEEAD